jgi:NAD-dependent dihydropyrimidine dehydrogenase PreA subunit/nitroreductase
MSISNYINQTSCKNCNSCILVCPNKIIEKQPNGKTSFDKDKLCYCILCGQCMAVCSTRSISLNGLTYGKEIIEYTKPPVDYDALYNLLLSRRSVRNYKSIAIADELIRKMVNILSLAPYGALHDKVEVIIINDKAILEKALPLMSEFYGKIGKWMSSPFMRYMMKRKLSVEKFATIDKHLMPNVRRKHYDINGGVDNITRNAPAVMIFHAPPDAEEHTDDSLIYVTYAAIAAHSLGLGATINGLIPPAINKIPELKRMFRIPEGHEAVTSLIFGYPKVNYLYGISRNRLKVNKI